MGGNNAEFESFPASRGGGEIEGSKKEISLRIYGEFFIEKRALQTQRAES